MLVFFFKQKTAYERRIRDWSSDVCSSDLSPSMTVQLDSPQGNTAAQQSSVWSQPQSDRHSLFNPAVEGPREVATVDQARVDANGRREQATEIDGNANNTGTRELTRSSTGQPLFIDKLGSTAQVDITRERTAEPDPRSGQYSVLADQLVFKTGNSDDQVKVTQGENGQLRFDVKIGRAHV